MEFPTVIKLGSGTIVTAIFIINYGIIFYMIIEKKFSKIIRIILGIIFGCGLLFLIPGIEFFWNKLNAFFYLIYY